MNVYDIMTSGQIASALLIIAVSLAVIAFKLVEKSTSKSSQRSHR